MRRRDRRPSGLTSMIASLTPLSLAIFLWLAACIAPSVRSSEASHIPTRCEAPFNVGFRVVSFAPRRKMAVWYPSAGSESAYEYAKGLGGSVARDGAPASCGRFPLVLFSHGFGGCGTQSV